MPLYRNWPAICAITNPRLKLLVALEPDEEVLEGLNRGFPGFFTEEPPQQSGPWPLSVLKYITDKAYADEDSNQIGDDALEAFGFPIVKASVDLEAMGWHDGLQLSEVDANELTSMWTEGRSSMFPDNTRRVTIRNVEYYVGYVEVNIDPLSAILYPCSLVDENG